jgi:acetyl esterase
LPLHSSAQKYLDELKALNLPPKRMLPIATVRRNAIANATAGKARTEVGSVTDQNMPSEGGEVPLRIYTPIGKGLFPAIVYFHGGGWATNNLDTHDELCRKLSVETGSVVISTDYRLAPEAKFPAGMNDAAAAVKWTFGHARDLNADASRILVAGDSSGGNFAAALCLRFRDENGPPIAGQILYYPVTDYYQPGTQSYRTFSEGYGLAAADMAWFWDLYLPDKAAADDPYASPLRAKNLKGLPPALVITAEYDPLVDEGHAYAMRLQESGVPTRYSCYAGTIHGFLIVSALAEDTARAIRETNEWLESAFASRQLAVSTE